ncbi:GNAT family N-acetyltransferase [Singulisphaera acidiphila]|uniref:Putative acyltransferase n=1 Tax=Singulisphaera acidiphila (strain ATCC BAA-1392 / DSM 18658 / VKM B-2454 / MOB10) TaxID=886293 RepID=L0D6W4_SINAD|nr:GNAT family N-acetyltransferase [Singulisphaera acidiphila]AGA24615.1 putative acyltransferase [Singulisphaera acidiphila DSM 18658]
MLDNPIWSALVTRQARFALGGGRVKRYPADIAPFIAAAATELGVDAGAEMLDLAMPGERLYMIGVELSLPAGLEVERRSLVSQMVCERRVGTVSEGEDCAVLGPDDVPDMLELTALVFPGYFRPRTIELGTYVGVRRDGRLIAMAGQRMGLLSHREISGICTHPDHRGQGYARRLVTWLVDATFREGLVPFLHVDGENNGARAAYEKLGFVARCDLPLLCIRRSGMAPVVGA